MSSGSENFEDDLPAVDEHLLRGETRYEIIDGRLVYVPPADEPHAALHAKLGVILNAHVGAEFMVALDMLTRTSKIDDFAPDASIYPRARNPETGGRHLEQLVFEIASTETLGDAAKKAGKLSTRGVRRVFAIDVKRARVLEWSHELETWSILALDAVLVDPCLAVPLPLKLIVNTAAADDDVARALLAKENIVLREAISKAAAELEAEAKAAAILAVAAARGLAVPEDLADRVRNEREHAQLDAWIGRVATCESLDVLFD